jgi:ribosomal protein S18 acetylase RimI-like enzyme
MADAEFYVIDGPDRLRGYTMLAFDPPPLEGDWRRPLEVKRIYVEPASHGTGLAQELMDVAVQRARQGGHDWIWLGTNEQNERALAFYSRAGFQVVGRRTFSVAHSIECDFVLARRLEVSCSGRTT